MEIKFILRHFYIVFEVYEPINFAARLVPVDKLPYINSAAVFYCITFVVAFKCYDVILETTVTTSCNITLKSAVRQN
jgi:hypothetical protein